MTSLLLQKQRSTDPIRIYLERVAADSGTSVLDYSTLSGAVDRRLLTASWLFIPSARKVSTAYSILPLSGADLTCVRGTTGTEVGPTGLLQSAAINLPRFDWQGQTRPGALSEESRTNRIRNNTMVGAVAGIPGTLPTNYQQLSPSPSGLIRQIIGTVIENGVNCLEVRYSGTATDGSINIAFEQNNIIAASPSQAWTNSCHVRVISAPNPPLNYGLAMVQRNSGLGFIATQRTIISPNSSLLRFSSNYALTPANTAFVIPLFDALLTIGQSYDFTIRIGWPQMELGSVATSPIPTTGTIQTRNADQIFRTGASALIGTSGALYADAEVNRNGHIIMLSDGTANNSVQIDVTGTRQVRARVVTSGTTNTTITSGTLPAGRRKLSFGYVGGDFRMFVDGVAIGANTAVQMPSGLSRIDIGSSLGTSSFKNERIFGGALWNAPLDPTRLAEISTI